MDYDVDDDGLIEISHLAQLDAMRYDLDSDGTADGDCGAAYSSAFPGAEPGMGCPASICAGYELIADLDFETNGNGQADASDAYWNGGTGWVPIGDHDNPFATNFDSGNHTIANLYINRQNEYPASSGYFSSRNGYSSETVGLFDEIFLGDMTTATSVYQAS